VTGAEVRRIRHGLQLTQAALGRALGVTRVTVARWEIGVYAIPEPTARLLQRVRNEGRRAKRRQ
jgi:DNA-binding transcriptional regulator YiaG